MKDLSVEFLKEWLKTNGFTTEVQPDDTLFAEFDNHEGIDLIELLTEFEDHIKRKIGL